MIGQKNGIDSRLIQFLEIYEAGFNLVPSGDDGKIPAIQWKWHQENRQEVSYIYKYFHQKKNRNFFVVTGSHPWDDSPGVVVVDGDDFNALAEIVKRCPITPLKVKTSKGCHYYFKHPGYRVQQILGVVLDGIEYKIDIKADGNYVVAPGSYTRDGKLYEASTVITRELIESLPVYDPAWLPHDPNSVKKLVELTVDDDDEQVQCTTDCETGEHSVEVEKHPMPIGARISRCEAYISACRGTQEGNGADNKCYNLAVKVVWGFLLPASQAVKILRAWGQREDQIDSLGGEYHWTVEQIEHKVRDVAAKKPKEQPGWMLLPTEEDRKISEKFERWENEFQKSKQPGNPAIQEPARVVDRYQADLEASGIGVVGIKEDSKVHYYVDCPRTGLGGEFWREKGGIACGYESPEGRRTWTDGKALFQVKVRSGGRRAYTIAELEQLPTPTWVVDGHVPENSTNVFFGPSNIGKTFIALSMALSVGSGKPYLRRFPVKKTPVCYLVGEGFGGYKNRVKAWMKQMGVESIPDFALIPYQFDLAGNPESEAENIMKLCKEKIGQLPGYTVIDTLNKNFGGKNENDTQDMTRFCMAMDYLREHTGGCVQSIHHTGKDLEKGPRGNLALTSNVDCLISAEEYGQREGIIIRCQKMKDFAFFRPYVSKPELIGEGIESSLFFEFDHEIKEIEKPIDAKQKWKTAADAILCMMPTSEAEAWSKTETSEKVRGRMKGNGCDDIPHDKAIREAIESLLHNGRLASTKNANPNHVKFYKKEHTSGFALDDFFASEVEQIEPENHLANHLAASR